jgi:hypothetical protein
MGRKNGAVSPEVRAVFRVPAGGLWPRRVVSGVSILIEAVEVAWRIGPVVVVARSHQSSVTAAPGKVRQR